MQQAGLAVERTQAGDPSRGAEGEPRRSLLYQPVHQITWGRPSIVTLLDADLGAGAGIERTLALLQRFGVVPTLLLTAAAVASTPDATRVRELVEAGQAEPGAWLPEIPPGDDPAATASALTLRIEQLLGRRPVLFRGPPQRPLPGLLEALGYLVQADAEDRAEPFWFGQHRRLLSLPVRRQALSRHGVDTTLQSGQRLFVVGGEPSEAFYADFFGRVGGEAVTPAEVYRRMTGIAEVTTAAAADPLAAPPLASTVVAREAAALVSVVIPAHNAERTLKRALDSVLCQQGVVQEIIIVDDASRDRTAEVAAACAPEARFIRLERNRGAAGARNVGIAAARGEFVAFLDADDEWRPGKSAQQLARLQANPRMVFIGCLAQIVSPEGRIYDVPHADLPAFRADAAWRTMLSQSVVWTPCIMARRAALIECGGFDPQLKVAEDQDLWIKLSRLGELGFLHEPLVLVHDNPHSLTHQSSHDEIDFLLPMIAAHLRTYRSELSSEEYRAILRLRYRRIGRNAIGRGLIGTGLRLLLRAAQCGEPVLDTVRFLIAASPLGQLKRGLLGS